jgi:hypothetical protein
MARKMRRSEEMFPVVETYLASPVTQKAFCSEHAISQAVLNYWLAKYRCEAETLNAFLEIRPVEAAPEHPLLEVCYPTGVKLRIFSPLKAAYLDHQLSV